MAAKGLKLPKQYASPFDVEGHRGARTYRPENTLPAFQYALERHVTTLETDTGVTKDGVLVISHNRAINGVQCHDTAPAFPGDPQYPYAGDLIKDLTLAEIKTLDCGFTDPGFPQQVRVPTQMPTLQELFDYVKANATYPVRFNIETKISPLVDDTVPYDLFTQKLVDAIRSNELEKRAMIQSFDWRTIMLAKKLDPKIETVALVWQFAGSDCDNLDDECSLEAVIGDPSVGSPWTGGLDWWDYPRPREARHEGEGRRRVVELAGARPEPGACRFRGLLPQAGPGDVPRPDGRRAAAPGPPANRPVHDRRRGDDAARHRPRGGRDHLRRRRPAASPREAQRARVMHA